MLANDVRMARAGADWNEAEIGINFVDQLDYQLSFRSKVDFMSTNVEHIAGLLERKPINAGIKQMGLYMTNDELDEMARRDAIGDRIDQVVDAVTPVDSDRSEGDDPRYGDNFAGAWQDQMDGGTVIFFFVDPSKVDRDEIELILDGSAKIVRVQHTYDQLVQYQDEIVQILRDNGADFAVGLRWSPDAAQVEVSAADPESTQSVLDRSKIPGSAYSVTAGGEESTGKPQDTHAWVDQQPGLATRISDDDSSDHNCGWGFNGHTSSYNYIVTAGHCVGTWEDTSGWRSSSVFQISQTHLSSFPRDLSLGNTYVRSERDYSSWDVSRISSGYADDNCYHGNNNSSGPHCLWPMNNRASHNSWETNSDRTCTSLSKSNVYRCGYITQEDVTTSQRDRVFKVDFTVIPGDSGSGAKWDYTIDGIQVSRNSSTFEAYFQTAYDTKVQLGFDFNCHTSEKHTTANGWGSCPVVNR